MQRPSSKNTLRKIVKNVATSPWFGSVRQQLCGQATVLCYHRLTKRRYTGRGFYPNIYLGVRDDLFEEQIKYISHSFSVATLDQIVSGISAKKSSKHLVGVSFDDGYRDNLEVALPILEKYNVPATIFVASGLIDRKAALWWEELGFILTHSRELKFEWDGEHYHFILELDQEKGGTYIELNKLFKKLSVERQTILLELLRPQCPVLFDYNDLLLEWDELIELSKHPLITLGCHTENHPILSNEIESTALAEMTNGRDSICDKTKHPVDLFAYPIGGVEEASFREFSLAEQSGFKASFTTRTGHIFSKHSSHMQSLPRITVDYFDTLDGFKWKLSGFASLLQNKGNLFITN